MDYDANTQPPIYYPEDEGSFWQVEVPIILGLSTALFVPIYIAALTWESRHNVVPTEEATSLTEEWILCFEAQPDGRVVAAPDVRRHRLYGQDAIDYRNDDRPCFPS